LKFKGYVNKLFLINYYLNKKDIKCMTKITKEEVKKVAHLARLELNENEINNHAQQLEKILDYIKQLEKIDMFLYQISTCPFAVRLHRAKRTLGLGQKTS